MNLGQVSMCEIIAINTICFSFFIYFFLFAHCECLPNSFTNHSKTTTTTAEAAAAASGEISFKRNANIFKFWTPQQQRQQQHPQTAPTARKTVCVRGGCYGLWVVWGVECVWIVDSVREVSMGTQKKATACQATTTAATTKQKATAAAAAATAAAAAAGAVSVA